jgi:hypothetical protein
VTLPKNLEGISDKAFKNNKILSITIPDGVEFVSYSAFLNNPLQSITIGHNVHLWHEAFPLGFHFLYESVGKLAGTYYKKNNIWYKR